MIELSYLFFVGGAQVFEPWRQRVHGWLYFFVGLAAARLTSASLILPVFFLISPRVVSGRELRDRFR
jgi:hypothetical protein